jgi:predicted nucleic acid-binding protein
MERKQPSFQRDSVILIDHFNGCDAASTFIGEHPRELAISAITRAEVLTGFSDAEIVLPQDFLAFFPTLASGEPEAHLAAHIRRESRWKLPDAFQAAVAMIHGPILVTRNSRDFSPDRHPFILIPYAF